MSQVGYPLDIFGPFGPFQDLHGQATAALGVASLGAKISWYPPRRVELCML